MLPRLRRHISQMDPLLYLVCLVVLVALPLNLATALWWYHEGKPTWLPNELLSLALILELLFSLAFGLRIYITCSDRGDGEED